MPNGSLETLLAKNVKHPLSELIAFKTILCIACAMSHLHSHNVVGCLSTKSIAYDADWNPKLAEFDLGIEVQSGKIDGVSADISACGSILKKLLGAYSGRELRDPRKKMKHFINHCPSSSRNGSIFEKLCDLVSSFDMSRLIGYDEYSQYINHFKSPAFVSSGMSVGDSARSAALKEYDENEWRECAKGGRVTTRSISNVLPGNSVPAIGKVSDSNAVKQTRRTEKKTATTINVKMALVKGWDRDILMRILSEPSKGQQYICTDGRRQYLVNREDIFPF
jgi:hypothetical protein